MWALVKLDEVIDKVEDPYEVSFALKKHLSLYRWVQITEYTGPCEIGDAFYNNKFIGPITLIGDSDFSPYYRYAENDKIRSTTSQTYQKILELETDDLDEGLYRISWTYNWNFNKTNGVFDAILYNENSINGILDLNSYPILGVHGDGSEDNAYYNTKFNDNLEALHNVCIFTHRQEPNESGGKLFNTGSDQSLPVSSFKSSRFSGVNKFVLYYKSGKHSTTASIWDCRLDIARVGK